MTTIQDLKDKDRKSIGVIRKTATLESLSFTASLKAYRANGKRYIQIQNSSKFNMSTEIKTAQNNS